MQMKLYIFLYLTLCIQIHTISVFYDDCFIVFQIKTLSNNKEKKIYFFNHSYSYTLSLAGKTLGSQVIAFGLMSNNTEL